jgi:hypothetical protein
MLFDPIILFFIVGIFAKACFRTLHVPKWLNTSVSLTILLIIGLKGGIELSRWSSGFLLVQMSAVILLSLCTYYFSKLFLSKIAHYAEEDAIVVAAHYGSVSVTTFAFALNVLQHKQIYFEPYMPLFVAIMEFPAILLASIRLTKLHAATENIGSIIKKTFTCKSISVLLISILFGYFFGLATLDILTPLLFDNFRIFLALLLLEMGVLVGDEFSHIKNHACAIILASITLSLGCACLGLVCGLLLGLSQGGIILLMILASSASYIAVPAVLRQNCPQARVSFALGHALGVTFPFNIFIGIYLYTTIVQAIYAYLL